VARALCRVHRDIESLPVPLVPTIFVGAFSLAPTARTVLRGGGGSRRLRLGVRARGWRGCLRVCLRNDLTVNDGK
jgi:hypothetical protein